MISIFGLCVVLVPEIRTYDEEMGSFLLLKACWNFFVVHMFFIFVKFSWCLIWKMKKERKIRVYAFSCAATVFLGSVSNK